MNQHPVVLAITLAFATSFAVSGCDRTASLTEQEHIQRAKDFEDKGNFKGSIVELKNAIQKNPDSPQARLLLGQTYLKVGMGAEAEKELSQAKKLGVGPEMINPYLGEALLLIGEPKRLLDEILPSEQTSPANRARILQLRGDALLRLGKLKEGCDLYQQSLDIDRNNAPTYWGLAQCAIAERDNKKARGWLDTALKIQDQLAKTWIILGELELIDNNPEGALAAYTNALKLDPENPEALRSRAAMNIGLKRFEPAKADIEKIQKLAPDLFVSHYLLALLKSEEKKYPEARDALQKALKISPDNISALFLGGSIEFALGNLQTAESYLSKVVRATPRNGPALKLLAMTQLRAGRPDDAEKTFAPIDMEKVRDAGVFAIAGEIALVKKEFSKAASNFDRAAELNPENATIRTELGMARLALGDDRALEDLQAAAGMEGSSSRADTVIILSHLKQEQYDSALESIAALEKKLGESPLTLNYQAAAYLGKDDKAKARSSLEQALKIDPKFFPAAVTLAKLDILEGQATTARKRFEGILKAEPTNLQAILAMAELSQRTKDDKTYLSWLEKAAKAHPQSLSPREEIARYWLERGEKNKALAAAQEAVNANPENPAALNLLGSTQMATGQNSGAVTTFTKLTKKANQSPDAYQRLALAHIANRNFSDARIAVQTALKIKPGHIPSLDTQLRIELADKKPEAALQIARQLQVKYPNAPFGFDREANILLSQKRYPQAIKAYEQALTKGAGTAGLIKLHRALLASGESSAADQRLAGWIKQNPEDLAARIYAAEFFMQAKRNRDAIVQYEAMLKRAPDNVVALNNLANLYLMEKDERALTIAERAAKLAPDQPGIQDTLGWILVEQGQTERGLNILRKATTQEPNVATYRYHLAVALARSGEKAQARKELERALSIGQAFPESGAAKSLLKGL